MQESSRTLYFGLFAGISLLVAVAAAPRAPRQPSEFSEVGQEFFPEFKDASEAKSLQVVAFDADTASASAFAVEQKDGKWRIPSRHNYPADGKERLAKAAASLIGLKREAYAGKQSANHKDFGVVDPLDEKSGEMEGRGQRLTLKKADGSVLADYIIGKAVPGRTGQFYIRRPNEDVTYTTKLDLQLSAKFADWIEPDLLKVDRSRLNQVVIDSYSIDEERGALVKQEFSVLSRKSSTDKWQLKDLNTDSEELNEDEVRKLEGALDDLKIEGIRPKPARLRESLKLAEGVTIDQGSMIDLQNKGFFFIPTKGGGGQQLISKEGAMTATTDEGVAYTLYFGDVFTGSTDDIEVGASENSAQKTEGSPAKSRAEQVLKKNRYLFVTVSFDKEGLGEIPVEPKLPEVPPGFNPEEPAKPVADETPLSATEVANGPAEVAKQEYLAAKAMFDANKSKFEADLKAYQAKIEAGEKKVKELNGRFAEWYYVISADSFENLRQGRKSLVKPKSASDEKAAGAGTQAPLPGM